MEAPSEHLADIAFGRELHAQKGLTQAIGWVDLAHTISLAEQSVIPRDDARALIAALLALHNTPSSFVPTAAYGDLYTNREAWLAERTAAVGWLGVARARREALTTAYHLALCDELLSLGRGAGRDGFGPQCCVLAVSPYADARFYLSTGGSTDHLWPLPSVLRLANTARPRSGRCYLRPGRRVPGWHRQFEWLGNNTEPPPTGR